MKTQQLTEVLERIEKWPAEAQDELAALAREMDAGLSDALYRANAAELAGIDRGLAAAAKGAFASDEAIETVFSSFRRT